MVRDVTAVGRVKSGEIAANSSSSLPRNLIAAHFESLPTDLRTRCFFVTAKATAEFQPHPSFQHFRSFTILVARVNTIHQSEVTQFIHTLDRRQDFLPDIQEKLAAPLP